MKFVPWVKFWTIRSRVCWFTSFKVLRGQTGIEIWHFEVHRPLAHQILALLLGQRPVGGHNEVGLAVLVNQSATGLYILEAQVFAKQSIGDHPAGTSFQHWKKLKSQDWILNQCQVFNIIIIALMLEESQVISPVPNLFLWDPARFRPAVPQIKCQERGELVLISPVYDYGETGYIGNMQLPPQPTDITHISMGNSAITLCVHQWQIKGKERLLCVILCNNSCYAWNVWCMDLNWHNFLIDWSHE